MDENSDANNYSGTQPDQIGWAGLTPAPQSITLNQPTLPQQIQYDGSSGPDTNTALAHVPLPSNYTEGGPPYEGQLVIPPGFSNNALPPPEQLYPQAQLAYPLEGNVQINNVGVGGPYQRPNVLVTRNSEAKAQNFPAATPEQQTYAEPEPNFSIPNALTFVGGSMSVNEEYFIEDFALDEILSIGRTALAYHSLIADLTTVTENQWTKDHHLAAWAILFQYKNYFTRFKRRPVNNQPPNLQVLTNWTMEKIEEIKTSSVVLFSLTMLKEKRRGPEDIFAQVNSRKISRFSALTHIVRLYLIKQGVQTIEEVNSCLITMSVSKMRDVHSPTFVGADPYANITYFCGLPTKIFVCCSEKSPWIIGETAMRWKISGKANSPFRALQDFYTAIRGEVFSDTDTAYFLRRLTGYKAATDRNYNAIVLKEGKPSNDDPDRELKANKQQAIARARAAKEHFDDLSIDNRSFRGCAYGVPAFRPTPPCWKCCGIYRFSYLQIDAEMRWVEGVRAESMTCAEDLAYALCVRNQQGGRKREGGANANPENSNKKPKVEKEKETTTTSNSNNPSGSSSNPGQPSKPGPSDAKKDTKNPT